MRRCMKCQAYDAHIFRYKSRTTGVLRLEIIDFILVRTTRTWPSIEKYLLTRDNHRVGFYTRKEVMLYGKET